MATYYFSSSEGSNTTGLGTVTSPWKNFSGKKNGANALSPGDICLFKAGDTWTQQEVIVDSNGTAQNPIVIDRYGSGNDPLFIWSQVVTGWTYTGANGIYYKSGLYQYAATVGVDGTYSLYNQNFGIGKTSSTIDAGCYYNASGTIYIRLSDGSNPSGHTIYVPSGDQSIDRGVIGGSKSRGSYVNIYRMKVLYANARAFCFSQPHSSFNYCTGIGSGSDNFLLNGYTPQGEMASYCTIDNCYSSYGVSGGVGGNSINSRGGQGITVGADHCWVKNTISEYNWAAGIDFLDYSSDTDVRFGGAVYCRCNNNGQAPSTSTMYDPGIYIDGAHDMLIYGNVCYNSGSGTQTRDADGIKVTTENSAQPVYNNHIVNNLVYNFKGYGIEIVKGDSGSAPNAPSTYGNTVVNNTIVRGTGGFGSCFRLSGLSSSVKTIFKNNICYSSNSSYPIAMYTNTSSVNLDSDYNCYWDSVRGAGSVLWSSSSTASAANASDFTLAELQAAGFDTHSINSNPNLIDLTFATLDAHLNTSTSPCINAGVNSPWTPPQWVIDAGVLANNGAVVGSTRPDGVSDTGTLDMGYHYYTPTPTGSLTSTNVEPATLYVSTTNNVSCSFTTANTWPSDGKLEITFPTTLAGGFTFNSGGTTTASFASGGSGSLAVSIVGSIVTLTRSGGSDIAASQAVVITLTNIQNPSLVGSTGAYQIKTTTSAGTSIDIDTNVSADQTIDPPSGFRTITISGVSVSNIRFMQ